VVYSFALLVGGTGAPLAGWIVDRFGLRALTVIGMSAAALATASASQVRRPVYDSSVAQWRHYAAQLATLSDALASAGIAL